MLARTLVWVGLQSGPEVLAKLVRELSAGPADVVVLVQPGATDDDLLLGYQTAVQANDGKAIIGLAARAKFARRARADLVAADASKTPTRGHLHALTVAVAGDGRELEQALANDDVDAVVVPPALVTAAVVLAPPAAKDSKPWFALAGSLAEGDSLIAAGARRLAVESPSPGLEAAPGDSPGAMVAAYRAALAVPWREEMGPASFAALAAEGHTGPGAGGRGFASARPDGSSPGRPVPDAPLAKTRPHQPDSDRPLDQSAHEDDWSSPSHHEKGPDDHW